MSAAIITNPGELMDELRRFEPVSDAIVVYIGAGVVRLGPLPRGRRGTGRPGA